MAFKFTHQRDAGGPLTSMELPSDANIDEVVDAFSHFLLAVGYHPDNIKDALGDADGE